MSAPRPDARVDTSTDTGSRMATSTGMTTNAAARRRSRLRPSRAERAPYTDALAQGVAEGRLTDALYEERLAGVESATTFGDLDALVADVPFEPADDAEAARTRPRWRRITALSVVGVVTAGAACAGGTVRPKPGS